MRLQVAVDDAPRVDSVDSLGNIPRDTMLVQLDRLAVSTSLNDFLIFLISKSFHGIVETHVTALECQLEKLAILLQCKATHDVGVLIAIDEHLDLLLREID